MMRICFICFISGDVQGVDRELSVDGTWVGLIESTLYIVFYLIHSFLNVLKGVGIGKTYISFCIGPKVDAGANSHLGLL